MSNAEHDRRIDYIEFSVRACRTPSDSMAKLWLDLRGLWAGLRQLRRWAAERRLPDGRQECATGGPLVVIYAADLEAMEQRVTQAGGRIVKPIFSFPGGRRFHFTDPSGNELAVWSDKEKRER